MLKNTMCTVRITRTVHAVRGGIHARRISAFPVYLVLLLYLLSGCGLGDVTNQINASTQQAIAALDDAITKLSNANADWQNILGDLQNKLPAAEQTIKNDVSDV